LIQQPRANDPFFLQGRSWPCVMLEALSERRSKISDRNELIDQR
jgi:hypothetical protein